MKIIEIVNNYYVITTTVLYNNRNYRRHFYPFGNQEPYWIIFDEKINKYKSIPYKEELSLEIKYQKYLKKEERLKKLKRLFRLCL
ncbi:MAG: hypothetical protein HPY57_15495 [Ignavibacteria bacterium]|nr:hypothetical protein [Ignavibacteria bacterium]